VSEYFAGDAAARAETAGRWVRWDALEPIEMVPGLGFQPVLAGGVMVNFVSFEPNTAAPVHWHDEEQISVVIDGELEFEVGGETRMLRRGDAVVIPPNTPHGARSLGDVCLAVDVFHPPRQAIADAMPAGDA
jgi:unsaturated pyranuronate lyase